MRRDRWVGGRRLGCRIVIPESTGFDEEAWLRQASRHGAPPAWTGVDRCTRPTKGRGACEYAGKPHRHCECGLPITLDHGFCDDCIVALIRGAAMNDEQSDRQRQKREAWLERYGFIEFTETGFRVRR